MTTNDQGERQEPLISSTVDQERASIARVLCRALERQGLHPDSGSARCIQANEIVIVQDGELGFIAACNSFAATGHHTSVSGALEEFRIKALEEIRFGNAGGAR